MTPGSFDYHAPRSVPDAIGLLGELGDEAKLLAGGHSLLPMMKLRFAQPGHLIDLGRIAELRGIREEAGTIRIGAMTTENDCWSKLLADKCRCWSRAPRRSPTRRCATGARSAATSRTATRATTIPALMLALDASFVLAGPTGERVVTADGFFVGLYDTLLEPRRDPDADPHPGPRGRAPAGVRQAQAQDRRLRHRRGGGDAAHEGRHRGPGCRIALTNVGPTRAEGARRRGLRCSARRSTTRACRGGAPGDEHLRPGAPTSAATPNTRPRWPAR